MQLPMVSNIATSRAMSIVSGAALAILWIGFSIVHLQEFFATGDLTMLLLVIAETMGAAFYLFRTDPATVSTRPLDWLIAVAGTCSALLYRPAEYALIPGASYFIIPAVAMQILALASLNRSFAIVPAKRILKTSKMYGIARHPLYASYCAIFAAYLLANTSIANAAVYAIMVALLVARIYREEAHLMKDEAYRAYAQKTRYRMVPFIY